ncbi:MAG: 16S rRNA (guanine(966)-N(2))-methyltransferase RsmD [Planctomycetota bacterium]
MPRKHKIRITGGSARGRPIPSPKARAVRPTPGIVREALFNILRDRVEGATVLELFAGVGTLGLEALSRDAAFATFVEIHPPAAAAVRATADSFGWLDRVEIITLDAYDVLPRLESRSGRYSIVFIDPPYAHARSVLPGSKLHDLIERLGGSPVLADDALLFLQHPRKAPISDAFRALELDETRPYGSTAITIFRKRPSSAPD